MTKSTRYKYEGVVVSKASRPFATEHCPLKSDTGKILGFCTAFKRTFVGLVCTIESSADLKDGFPVLHWTFDAEGKPCIIDLVVTQSKLAVEDGIQPFI